MRALIAWLHSRHCAYADLRRLIEKRSQLDPSKPWESVEAMPDLSRKTKAALRNYKQEDQLNVIERRCCENETQLILWGDPGYPSSLYEVEEPPPVLYVRGKGRFPSKTGIAIVGSRHTTSYGVRSARSISRRLAAEGLVVISGLAEGIDTAAHRAALEAGETLAVLGCGMDWIYPKSNARLYQQIAKSGVLVTEFPFGEKPYGYHFPFRNRIISGLSDGILFIEGTHKSGAMSTVQHGLNQGKTIYALPGDVDRKMSEGANQLIFDGAEPLLSVEQILDRYQLCRAEKTQQLSVSLTAAEKTVLYWLNQEPMGIEKICNLSNLPIHDIVSVLTSLELNGLVVRQGNHYYRSRR